MNAPTTIAVPDPFASAIDAVNAWRGQCLWSFARAERAVTEALSALAGAGKAAVPHLTGQRFSKLADLLQARGDADTALAAVRAFEAHAPLRVFLCHGDSVVTLDRKQQWHVAFTVVTGGANGLQRQYLALAAHEAATIARDLSRERNRLVAALDRVSDATCLLPGMPQAARNVPVR